MKNFRKINIDQICSIISYLKEHRSYWGFQPERTKTIFFFWEKTIPARFYYCSLYNKEYWSAEELLKEYPNSYIEDNKFYR